MSRDYVSLRSCYMESAFDHVRVGKSLRKLMDQHPTLSMRSFDTLVGTGLSGAIVLPSLARFLRKRFVVVRKPKDGSHSSYPVEGDLGKRWLFVDDLIASGATFRRTVNRITDAVADWAPDDFQTECVGIFLYGDGLDTASLSTVKITRYSEDERESLPNWSRARDEGWDYDRGSRIYLDPEPTPEELDEIDSDTESAELISAWEREVLAA